MQHGTDFWTSVIRGHRTVVCTTPPQPRHHSLRRQVSHKKHKTGLAVEICPVVGGGWGGGKQLKLCNRSTLAAHTHHWDWQCIWNWVGKKTKEAEEGEGRGAKRKQVKNSQTEAEPTYGGKCKPMLPLLLPLLLLPRPHHICQVNWKWYGSQSLQTKDERVHVQNCSYSRMLSTEFFHTR